VLVWLAEAQELAGFMTRSTVEQAFTAAIDAAPAMDQAQAAIALYIVPVLAALAALMLVIGRGWWEWPLFFAAIVPLTLGAIAVALTWGGQVALAVGPDARTGAMVELATAFISAAGLRPGLGAWIGGLAGLLAIICWGTQLSIRLVRAIAGPRRPRGKPDAPQ
jgi:hypothetical protein